MTRMYRPRPTPCGREQERVARKRTDVSRETSGGGDGAPCGGDLRGGGALRGRATSSQWQKAFEFGISSCLFAAQESGTLAKRLVVENHAPTSRIVQPYEAGTPSEFDAFLPSQPYSVPRKGNRDRRSSRAFDDVRWIGHVRAGARTGGAARRRAPGVHEPRHHCRADRRSRAGRAPGRADGGRHRGERLRLRARPQGAHPGAGRRGGRARAGRLVRVHAAAAQCELAVAAGPVGGSGLRGGRRARA